MRAVLIIGTVGVGKTSAAEAAGDLLAARGVPHAVVDLDGLSRFWPAPADDPFNFELVITNLRALAATYRTAGARVLLLAGVAETADHRRRFTEATGGELVVARLQAGPATVRERLTRRHADDPEGLAWHLKRAGELDRILREAAVEDFVVDATAPADRVAARVLAESGC
ncbi:hypothetical protein ACIBG7_38760 [Nonomuraea sp. NPDC050328]|uniref:hypothetical protein n=1 Tax=Nonomuraea sp. NPDC050328 TaxID=3364361 RepID=UPI0037881060